MCMRNIVICGLLFFSFSHLESFESFDQAIEYVSLQYDAAANLAFRQTISKLSSAEQEKIFVQMFQLINHHEAIYLEEILEDIKNLQDVVEKNLNNKTTAQQKYLQKSVEALQFFYSYAKKHRKFYHFLHDINALERSFYADDKVFQDLSEKFPAKVLGERYRIYENAKYPIMEYADKLDRNIKKLVRCSNRSGKAEVKEYAQKVLMQAQLLREKVFADKEYREECKTHQEFHPKRMIAEKTLVATFASLWIGAMIVTGIVYAAVFAQS